MTRDEKTNNLIAFAMEIVRTKAGGISLTDAVKEVKKAYKEAEKK